MNSIFLWLASLALAATAAPLAFEQAEPEAPRETKQSLPPEKMAALVERPMRAAMAGDLPRARRELDRLVEDARRRHGAAASVAEAELVTSFGVELFIQGSVGGREDMRQLSAVYMARAVEVSRRAFGPGHPEVAVALHSYAELLLQLQRKDPPEAAETALAEALSIRQVALGVEHIETLAAMQALARVKAARFRTAGKLEEGIELFRRAIALSRRSKPSPAELRPSAIRLALVAAYLNAGRRDDAAREAGKAFEEARRDGDDIPCFIDANSIAADQSRPLDGEALLRLLKAVPQCFDLLDRPDEAAAAD